MCCLSQLWDVADGRIVSRASPGRVVTLGNCGETSSRLQLCALDPEAAQPPGPGCTNTSCPTANTFNISALSSSASDLSSGSGNAIRGSSDQMLIANAYDGQCMEGMLGKNTVLFVRFNIYQSKMIVLPRQARDKHRERTQNKSGNRFLAGPQRSSVVTNPCAPDNIKQLWAMHADGTLRASNNQCVACH